MQPWTATANGPGRVIRRSYNKAANRRQRLFGSDLRSSEESSERREGVGRLVECGVEITGRTAGRSPGAPLELRHACEAQTVPSRNLLTAARRRAYARPEEPRKPKDSAS